MEVKLKMNGVVSGGSNVKGNKSIYLNADYLTYHTILSQGLGYPSGELWKCWKLLIENISTKFSSTEKDLLEDSKQNCFLILENSFMNFNSYKYDNAFPYFSEVIKRGFIKNFNKWHLHSKQVDYSNVKGITIKF